MCLTIANRSYHPAAKPIVTRSIHALSAICWSVAHCSILFWTPMPCDRLTEPTESCSRYLLRMACCCFKPFTYCHSPDVSNECLAHRLGDFSKGPTKLLPREGLPCCYCSHPIVARVLKYFDVQRLVWVHAPEDAPLLAKIRSLAMSPASDVGDACDPKLGADRP